MQAADTAIPRIKAGPMPHPSTIEHALLQSAMWTRLARQCRLCGDLDMEKDALTLARRQLGRASARRDPPSSAPAADAMNEPD